MEKKDDGLKGKYYRCGVPNEPCMYRVEKYICTFSIGSVDLEDRGQCKDAMDIEIEKTEAKGEPDPLDNY